MDNLSIILVNYNTRDITSECLNKLAVSVKYSEETLKNKIEVILVDNGSTDGSVQRVKTEFPWVKLIQSGQNLGFGAGNNLGMKEAKYPLVLLLNTDAYVEKNTLQKAVTYFQEHPDISVMGPKLTFQNLTFQPNAGFLPTPFKTTIWLLGLESIPGIKKFFPSVHIRNSNFYSEPHQVEWIMGAFMMLRKSVFEKTAGFDDKIFMYMEEVEWFIRIKQAGFKVMYTPDFSAVHLGGASSGGNIAVPLFREMEGLIYVYKKHYPNLVSYLKLLIVLGCLMRIVAFTLTGKIDRVKAYVSVLRNVK
jgi:GT2 family glycosyltransferase